MTNSVGLFSEVGPHTIKSEVLQLNHEKNCAFISNGKATKNYIAESLINVFCLHNYFFFYHKLCHFSSMSVTPTDTNWYIVYRTGTLQES